MNIQAKNNIPKLRFSEFSGDWVEKRLGEVSADIKSGKTKPKESGTFPVYGSTGKIGMCQDYTHSQQCILIARVGANAGKINFVSGKFGVTDNTLIFPDNSGFKINFILYLLIKTNLNKLVFGSGQPLITGGQLKNLKVSLPNLPEQEKIANFLTSIDKRIEKLEEKKSLLENYKKGVMQKIFSQKIRFKDEDGNDYPNWEKKKLRDVLNSVSTKSYQIKSSEILENGKFKVIDQGQGKIAGYSNEKDKLYKAGNVVIYGDHTIAVKYIDFNFIVGADGTKILVSSNKNNLKYLFYNLCFSNIRPEGYKRHFSILKNIYLILPFLPEQQKIANFLTSIDNKIHNIKTQISESKTFKKGLLQQMFV